MFVCQGARQFEIWTGKPAPVEQMRGAVLRQLGIRAPGASSTQPRPPIEHAEAPQPVQPAAPQARVDEKVKAKSRSDVTQKPVAQKSAPIAAVKAPLPASLKPASPAAQKPAMTPAVKTAAGKKGSKLKAAEKPAAPAVAKKAVAKVAKKSGRR
jgi:3-dehydroquinate dehydratase/shikimate dehydrogenase